MRVLGALVSAIALFLQTASGSVSISLGLGTMQFGLDESAPFTLGGRVNLLALEEGTWADLPASLGYSSLNEVFANLNGSFTPPGSVLVGQFANNDSGGPGVGDWFVNFVYSGNFNPGDQLLAVAYPTLTLASSSTVPDTPGFFFRTDSVIDGSDIGWVAPGDGQYVMLGAYTLDLGGSVPNNQFTAGSGAPGGNGFGVVPAAVAVHQFNVAAGQSETHAPPILGWSRVVKSGAGTLVLAGQNNYTAGTLVSSGTLMGDTTSVQGAITNSAQVVFDQTTNGKHISVLSGSGSMIKTGVGTLVLTEFNTQTGGTWIKEGALQIGDGGTRGWLAGAITNSATLIYNTTGNHTQSAIISGTGSLHKLGTGTVTLNGANSYSGGTLVQQGGLVGTISTIRGPITNNGTVVFDQPGNVTYSNSMTGTGNLVKKGSGAMTVTGDIALTGKVVVDRGLMFVGTGGTNGSISAASTIEIFTRLVYNRSDNVTLTSFILGAGTFDKAGAGTLTLAGTNRISFLRVSEGTLVAGNSGPLAINAITVESNGILDMAGHSLASSVIISTNRIRNNGGQILNAGTMENAELVGGITTIVGDDSRVTILSGDAALTLDGNRTTIAAATGGTLSVNGSGTTIQNLDGGQITLSSGREVSIEAGSFGSSISGAGGVFKVGTNSLLLSGTNSYIGPTVVSQGELKVDGSISGSAVTIAQGAALGGSGDVGAISGSGTVNPGNSPGILTASMVDPSGGLTFNFEFTSLNPVYSNAAGSPNDVLRLTSATPFVAALTTANTVNFYFNMDAVEAGNSYTGGIFTDVQADFLAAIAGADFHYYVKDATGPVTYNGQTYSLMADLTVGLSTVNQTGSFTTGPADGQVMVLSVVPEPSVNALLGLAVGSAA